MAAESAAAATTAAVVAVGLHRRTSRHCVLFGGPSSPIFSFKPPSRHRLAITATNEKSKNIDLSSPDDPEVVKLEVDKIVDGMDFGDLCNEFECISSPSVEATARQLARDILELREGNRTLGTYAVSVKYKDPVRSFTGREKYKRPRWAIDAFDKPSVIVLEMVMLSTSVLNIKWLIKGIPKSLLGRIGGEFTVKVNSKFTLNQISGQVIEHEESWDLSAPSIIAQSYFWVSRRLFAIIEAGRDITDSVKNLSSHFDRQKENLDIYPDPLGDPTKFFQRDDGFQRDVYEIALFIAVIYFVVQFLRTTL